jgi:hypothetical protein
MPAQFIIPPADYDDTKSKMWNRYRDRGTISCTACGAPVNLSSAAHGPDYAAACPSCGSLYNLSGQGLRPKSEWEEPLDGD